MDQATTTRTRATVAGRTYEIKIFPYGDGYGWTVKGGYHGFGFSTHRAWPTRDEAIWDAIARIEDEVA